MFCLSLICTTSALLGAVLLLIAAYWFKVRRSHYWKERNVPSDAPVPFVGNYLGMFKGGGSTFFEEDQERYKRFGRVFGGYEGFMPIIFVSDPELLRLIFVKDFNAFCDRRDFSSGDRLFGLMVAMLRGEQWRRVRSVVTPAFSTGKIKKMIPLMQECVETFSNNLLSAAETNKTIEAKSQFATFGFDVIANTVFGTKVDSANDPDNIFVKTVSSTLNQNYPWRFLFINMLPRLAKLLGITPWEPNRSQFFIDFCKDVVEKRAKQNIRRNDLIQILMDARKNSKDGQIRITDDENQFPREQEDEHLSTSFFEQYSKNKAITEDEFIALLVQFYTAGFEGVSTTMAMVAYFLALNPNCQEKLLKEVDRLAEKYNNDLGYDAIGEAKYLDNVLSETLRLAPPGVRLGREAQEDYKLGDTGITIPKGMHVIFPVYSMHHDPEFFPDPEKFDPDRFTPENKENIRPFTYLPFGSGPRHCIGMRLSLFEMKVCLLNIYRKYTFKTCAETDIPPKFFKGAFQYQPRSIALKVVKRNV